MDSRWLFSRISMICLFGFSIGFLYSQTGPGGVGTINGSGSLRIWLQGDDGVITSGDEATQWTDQSGWNNHAATIETQRPTLVTNSLNGLPGLQFSTDKMTIAGNASIQTAYNDIFVVTRRTSATNFGTILARRFYIESEDWESPFVTYSIQANKNSQATPYFQSTLSGPVLLSNYENPHNEITNGEPYLHQCIYNGVQLESWINNANPKFADGAGQLNYNSNNNSLMLGYGGGSSESYPNDYFEGLIYEVIYFGDNINVCKQVVVLNYLASKYGLSVAYDKYVEVAGFTNDVIGIGLEGPDTHLSSSGGGIAISTTAYPEDTWNSYIFTGHNNGEMKGTTLNVPSGYNNRLQRVWNLKSTGTMPENVSITFSLERNPANDKLKYGLLCSANADFSNPEEIAIANSVSVVNKSVTFYFSDPFSLDDGFYTLGNKYNQWNGNVGPLWETTANWDGNVPGEDNDVLVTGGSTNYPVLSQDVTLKSLSIETGGFLNAWTYTLQIGGNCNISGGFNAGTGKVLITGNQNSNIYCSPQSFHHLEISKSSGQTVSLMDAWKVTGNLTIFSGSISTTFAGELGGNLSVTANQAIWGRELILNGSSAQTLTIGANSIVSLSELVVNNSSTSQIVDASLVESTGELRASVITLNDGYLKWGHDGISDLEMAASTTFQLSSNVNVSKSWINNGGVFLPSGNTVTFTQGGSYNLKSSSQSFFGLTINKTGGSLTLMDNLQISGDFFIQTGSVNAGNKIVTLSGNLNITGTLNCETSEFIFDGEEPSEIQGNSTTFYKLTTQEPAVLEFNGTTGSEFQISNELNIGESSVIILGDDQKLSITGTMNNEAGNAGLIIKSGVTSTGSLIHNTAGIAATVERFITATSWSDPEDGWHLLASPVDNFLLEGSDFITFPANTYDFYAWSESQHLWLNQKVPENNITHFSTGEGYLVAYQAEGVKEFSGIIEVEDVEITGLTLSSENRGWHLLGNPFAPALEWNDGNWSLVNVAGVAKIWDEENKSYTDISAGEIIPSMQGFMVQVTEWPGSLVIPAVSRVHSTTPWYKSAGTGIISLVAIESSGRSAQKCTIFFNDEATTGFDASFDSRFLPGYAPQFYSVVGTEKLSTNSMPETLDEIAIPLVFIKNQASQFQIELIESVENEIVFLTDRKTGIIHNLTENPVYSFNAQPGDSPERFLLNIGSTGFNEPEKPEHAFAFFNGSTLVINTLAGISNLSIYNLQGQLTDNQHFYGEGFHSLRSSFQPGIYFLVLENYQKMMTTKIFIP